MPQVRVCLPPRVTVARGLTSHPAKSATTSDNGLPTDDQALHARVFSADPNGCDECSLIFPSAAALLRHGRDSKHQVYTCFCGKHFARLETVKRHINLHSQDENAQKKYECPCCHRRGRRGFLRSDHLIQHLQGFHRGNTKALERLEALIPSLRQRFCELYVCPRTDCNKHRSKAWVVAHSSTQRHEWPFKSQKQFDLHMRHMHGGLPYACPITQCDQPSLEGFKNANALLKHCRREHGVVRMEAQRRGDFLPWCDRAGCGLKMIEFECDYWRDSGHGYMFSKHRCPNSEQAIWRGTGVYWRHL